MRRLILFLLFLPICAWSYDLRQSTAVTLQIGPYLDATDGVTPETGLGLADDIEISKNGAVFTTVSSASLTYDSDGYYRWDATSSETDTLGSLVVKSVSSTVHVPVWHEYMILPSNVWDSLYSTDKLQVDVTEVSGTSEDLPTATNLQTVDDNVDAVKAKTDNLTFTGTDLQVTLDGETVTPGAGTITSSVIAADAIGASQLAANSIGASEIADGAIDAGAIATDAITAAKIAADAIGASELATNAIGSSEIASNAITAAKLATDSITSDEIGATAVTEIQSGLGTSANQTTIISNIATADTAIDGVQADLDNATDGLGALKTLIDALNDVSTSDLASALATYDGPTKAELDSAVATLYTAANGAIADASVNGIEANVAKLNSTSAEIELDGSVYRFTTNALEQAPSGGGGGGDATLANQTTIIAALTAQEATQEAILADTAAIPTAAAISDAVFDEAMSGHTTAGTFGQYMKWVYIWAVGRFDKSSNTYTYKDSGDSTVFSFDISSSSRTHAE